MVNFSLLEVNFEQVQSVIRAAQRSAAERRTDSRRSRNEFAGYILSPGLGRFYGGAGRCGASAEETEVDSQSLRRAADGKDRDSDGSQHR